MSEQVPPPHPPSSEPTSAPDAGDQEAKTQEAKKKKQKAKVRSAWISFFGRIIAQVLGAAATIVLGLVIIQKYQTSGDRAPADGERVSERTAALRPQRTPGEIALAVLPLQNFSSDPKQEYFADGLTEALITDLSHIEGLRVISRTSSMHYKGQRKPLPEIARELNVDFVVEGSIIKEGGRVRISAQLIDAVKDEHLWARSYDHNLHDVLSLQAEVATAIAREVNVSLTRKQQRRFAERRAVDPATYDLYLLGRRAWDRRTPVGFETAIKYFEQALQKDPEFALAHAGLADTYSVLGVSLYGAYSSQATLTRQGALTRARAAAERAIALDDELAEAHTSLAWVRRYDWDWTGADRSFQRALELNPGYGTAHQWYALFLAEQGRDREAVVEAQRAINLDPLSARMHTALGIVHYHGRRYDLAEVSTRRALEFVPTYDLARRTLARILIERGDVRTAIQLFEQISPSPRDDEFSILARAYAHAGDRNRADRMREQVVSLDPPAEAGSLARLHAGFDDIDAAFDALGRAIEQRSNVAITLKVDPLFERMRPDRRFAVLLKRVGLP